MPLPLPEDDLAADNFIAAFEEGSLPKERWTHGAHIFTGACYVHAFGEEAAIDRMRRNVSAYNLAVGGQNTATSGYHETVTILWIKLLAEFRAQHLNLDRVAFTSLAVEHFAPQRDLLRRHYDYDIVASTEARRVWVAPNLTSI
jgi:hypothetical protein